MTITHFSAQIIGSSRSPVAAAAYRHRTSMRDDTLGTTFTYTLEQDLAHAELSIPADAPAWIRDLLDSEDAADNSERLWNEVVAQEPRRNGQYAREIVIALPVELTRDQNIELIRAFIASEFTTKGLIADWVYHDKPANPHVHVMHTLRTLDATKFGRKRIPLLDKTGAVLRLNRVPLYRPLIGTRDDFKALRIAWGATASRHLALAGHDRVIDTRSYAAQGIHVAPTTHRGPAVQALVASARASRIAKLLASELSITAAQLADNPTLVLDLISGQMSTFTERDIARTIHRYVEDAETFDRIRAGVLAAPGLVALRPDIYDTETGTLVAAAVYATRAMVRLERDMADQAGALAASQSHAVAASTVASAVRSIEAADPTRPFAFNAEQIAAVRDITGAAGVSAVVGIAGTGKSTLLSAANVAWSAAGRRVHGAALAGKATEELTKSSGIAARTLASWELAWSKGRDLLQAGDVFVVDEAGMVASRQLAAVIAAGHKAGAKIVLVGDPEQLQPIEAGAAFRALIERVGFVELVDVRRQRETWQQAATRQFAKGQIAEALAAYRDAGCIVASDTKAEAITIIIADFIDAQSKIANRIGNELMVLAHANADVLALNQGIRTRLQAAGEIGGDMAFATARGPRSFATGDRLIFLENKRFSFTRTPDLGKQSVKNGMLGTVVATDNGVLRVRLDTGRFVEFDAATYAHVDHGYAATVHKNQGVTVDRAFVLASATMDRHLAYVAMSRHRDQVTLYAPKDQFKRRSLDDTLARSTAKSTTLDYDTEPALVDAYAERRGFQTFSDIGAALAATIAAQRAALAQLWTRASVHRPIVTTVMTAAIPAARPAADPLDPSVSIALPAVRWHFSRASTAALATITGSPLWTRRDAQIAETLTAIYRDPAAALAAITAAALEDHADPATLANAALGTYGRMARTGAPSQASVDRLKAHIRAQTRAAAAMRAPAIKAEQDRRARMAHAIPDLSPGLREALHVVLDAGTGGYAIAARQLARATELRDELANLDAAVTARFGAKQLWSVPTNAKTLARLLAVVPPAEQQRVTAALATYTALRKLNQFVMRTVVDIRAVPDDAAIESKLSVQPDHERKHAMQSNYAATFDATSGTIKYPYSKEANQIVGKVATWDKELDAYKLKAGVDEREVKAALVGVDRIMSGLAANQQRAETVIAQHNAAATTALEKHGVVATDLKLGTKDARLHFSIPAGMEGARDAAKSFGAAYAPTKDNAELGTVGDKSRWSIEVTQQNESRIVAGLPKVADAIVAAQQSQTLATTIRSPDDRLAISHEGDTVYLRSPHMPAANEHLKTAGFTWRDKQGAYGVVPENQAHVEKIHSSLDMAVESYDAALVPPTIERAGVDVPPRVVAEALKLDADALAKAYGDDPKLSAQVNRYLRHAEAATPDLKPALKAGDNEAVARSLGVPAETAAKLTAVHNKLNVAANASLDAALSQSRTQSQSMTR